MYIRDIIKIAGVALTALAVPAVGIAQAPDQRGKALGTHHALSPVFMS